MRARRRCRTPTCWPCPSSFCPYDALAERAWELRDDLTIYDATYVALAELLRTTLLTLDVRLARAPGPRCPIRVYKPAD